MVFLFFSDTKMSSKKCTHSPQDNILCCPICMDIYKVPRMLPCQHTLCETCLHSYIVNKSRERVLVSDFPCPVCRTSTPAPRAFTRIDTWSSLFPLNHLLVSLLDSSFHDLLEKKETVPAAATERCQEHLGKCVEFYCIEHSVKLCSKCFKNTHRQCNILDIEEHVEFTSRLSALKTNSENIRSYLNTTIDHLKKNIEQLHSQKITILTEVKDFREKVDIFLNAIENEIQSQVSEQHDSEVAVLTAQCEEYERIRAEIGTSEKTIGELPLPGNIVQTLEKIAKFENEIKDQLSFIQRCHANIELVKLNWDVENQLCMLLSTVKNMGSICAYRLESDLKEPPELVVTEACMADYMIPSRDTSLTSEDVPTSLVSSESMSVTRTTDQQSQPTSQAQAPAVQAPVLDEKAACQTFPGTRQSHKTRDQKRPKTVPIETTTPTPVVRPRPERPNVSGIPNFLPTLSSTPVYQAKRPTQLLANQRYSASICPETDMDTLQRNTAVSSAFSNVNLCCVEPCTGSKPPILEKPTHKFNQYANLLNVGTLAIRKNSISADDSSDSETYRHLCARRSLSVSSINVEDHNPTSPSLASASVRSAQHVDEFPVYENASSVSIEPVSNNDRCSTFITLANSAGGNQYKFCSHHKDFVVNVGDDARECTITGSVEMSDRRLILVDCNNSKIKMFSEELNFVCHLCLMKEPWNVTAMSGTDIAVTVPLEKKIYIINIREQTMHVQRNIKTRRECWGITYLDKKFIITTKDDGNEIAFLDEVGREINIVSFSSLENPTILRPVSITLLTNEHVLYVCCEGQTGTKGSLVRLSSSGEIVNVFTNKDLDRPYCVASNSGNEIFVAAIRSSNVLMLTEGGAYVATVLSRELGLNRPQHIHVTDWEGKTVLILTERRSDKANVYFLKK